MEDQYWNFDDDEFWNRGRRRQRTTPGDKGAGTPVLILPEGIPLYVKALALNCQVAIYLPLGLLAGTLLYNTRWLPEIIVLSVFGGFAVGLWIAVAKHKAYEQEKNDMVLFLLNQITTRPTSWFILLCTVLTPAVIFLLSIYTLWGSNRFLAVGIPAVLTGYILIRFGHIPIVFFEQVLLSQPEMPPWAKTNLALSRHRPNIELTVVLLAVIVAVPILLSNSIALLLVTLILAAVYLQYFSPSLQPRVNLAHLQRLLHFSYRIADWFVNYPEVTESDRPLDDLNEWAPPYSFLTRKRLAYALLALLDLTLIVGLSYYCPWEVFAKLTTNLPRDVTNNATSTLDGYSWLFAPFYFVFQADPPVVYLFCYVFALLGFVLLPPAILFAIYLPRVVELENIREELIKYRASTRL